MPDPVIDSKDWPAPCEEFDSEALVPERTLNDAQVSLAQFAAQISDVLKEPGNAGARALQPLMDLFQGGTLREHERGSGIAIHSSVLMELLGADSTLPDRYTPDKVSEQEVLPPMAPKIVTPPPLPAGSRCG